MRVTYLGYILKSVIETQCTQYNKGNLPRDDVTDHGYLCNCTFCYTMYTFILRNILYCVAKICIISKNGSRKNCSALNCMQKCQWAHMSISSRNGPTDLQKLPSFKYCYLQKWGNRFTLGLDTGKNTRCLQKCFKWKLFRIEFRRKKFASAYIYPPWVELGALQIDMFQILYCTEMEK